MPENVYLVMWCNGESYEDYAESMDAVFATEKAAINYILSQGYTPRPISEETRYNRERGISHYDKLEGWFMCSMWVETFELRDK